MLNGHSSVLWQDNIYIWGGKDEGARTGTSYSNTMYVMNPGVCLSQNTVTLEKVHLTTTATSASEAHLTSVVPRGRAYHCATLYGKLMFVTGGMTDDADASESNNATLPVFDMERRVWMNKTTFGDVPCARCHHASVVYGDTLMLHGGYPLINNQQKEITTEELATMQHAMYDVHELNMATMRWRRIQHAQSPALWGHSAVLYNKNVIIFGGVDTVENAESGAVVVWHCERKQWRWADFKNLELRCAMHSAVQDGGRMVVFSGLSFRTHAKLRTLYEFNLDFGSWRELHPKGAPPLGRIGHAAVAYNQCVFVIGGSVENPNNPSMMDGKTERAVHVYNLTTNEWRSCALVTNADTEVDAQRTLRQFAVKEKSWSAGGLDQQVQRNAEEEWSQTAGQVKDTIQRARAIQSLADTAMGNLATEQALYSAQQQQQQQQGATPRAGSQQQLQEQAQHAEQAHQHHQVGVPFDDTQRRNVELQQQMQLQLQQQQEAAQLHQSQLPQQQQSPPHESQQQQQQQQQTRGERALPSNLDNEEARRVIEYLQKENQGLRSQLEDFRSISANQSHRNPYEVPVFNAASVLPQNDGLSLPRSARGASPPHRSGSSGGGGGITTETRGEYVPRLNINVADAPKAVAGSTGYMSRSAVTSLVHSSLGLDSTSAAAMAAGSSSVLPPPDMRITSLDPMSFLTNTPYTAAFGATATSQQQQGGIPAWHPNSYRPPQSYDQLLSRANATGSGGMAGQGSYQAAPANLPPALQPLASLFGGVQPQQPQQQQQQMYGGYDASSSFAGLPPQNASMVSGMGGGGAGGAVAAGGSPGVSSFAATSVPRGIGAAMPQHTPRRSTPSLSKLVKGQGSMLSMSRSRQ